MTGFTCQVIVEKVRHFISNLVSLMCGTMLTWPWPILSKLTSNQTLNDNSLGRGLSPNEQSWILALAFMGGMLGAPFAALIMEKWGRKLAIASVYLPHVVATLSAAFGDDIWYYYVSRIAAGMGINAGILTCAVYLGEISESKRRGLIYSTASVSMNLGSLLSYCICPYTTIRDYNLILFGIALFGVVVTLACIPESPYFLLQKNQIVKAQESLMILRGTSAVLEEISILQKNISKIRNDDMFPIFRTKACRKAFLISLVLTSLQQFSGISMIFSYTHTIFTQSGTHLSDDHSSIAVGLTQFLAVFITVFGADKYGRKKMLTFAATGIAFSFGILATFFRFQDENNNNAVEINWLPLVCFLLFLVFFNSGMGALPILYMTEILPLNVKSASSSVIMAFYCLIGFLISIFFDSLTDSIGTSGWFYLFAGAMAVYPFYVAMFLFETKNKTFQEIEERLSKSNRSKNAFLQAIPNLNS